MNVFAIESMSTTATGLTAKVRLDARQPYLDHHRPGGDPLLGTAMAIELMSSLALRLEPGMRVRAIESMQNHAPFILHGDTAPFLDGTVSRVDAGGGLECSLSSVTQDDSRVVHFNATLQLANPEPRQSLKADWEAPHGLKTATSRDVYTLLFHGPAFRVIDTACWDQRHLYASAARDLPPCYTPSLGATSASPRLIEFALQTAGLFEIAANRRMMIPKGIRRIERFSDLEIDCGKSFAARAILPGGENAGQALDVEVVDETGDLQLRVTAYRTEPLPFSMDPAGPATLQRCFT